MKDFSNKYIKENNHVIVDFARPTEKTREEFNADLRW